MAQYTELRYFHLPPKLAQQTSLQVININNLISELQLLINTKVDKLYNRQLSLKNFTIIDKNTISKSQNLIVDLLNLINSLPDIVLSDWNTLDVDDMSYIRNKPNVPILDLSGLIPASYLPSYVDDVFEYPSFHDLPQPGEPGKIYVTTDNDLTYRWSGTTYVEISKSIITGVKGDAETNYRIGNVNLTAVNIGLGNVVNLDLSKAIKGITRNGLTFTYTCLDGTTGTFDQQDNNTWRGIQDNLTSSTNTTESLSAKQGYLLANGSARDNTKLPLAGGTMTGSITMSQGASARNVGIVGTYDYTKSAAIWAMGASYQIPAAGNSLGSLYGAAYVYQGLAGQGTMAGGHQFVWAQNGGANVALGNNVWTSGGFIKNGGTSSQFLKADGSVDSNAYITGITKAMVTTALGYTPPTTDHTYNFDGVSFTSGQSTTGEHNCNNITSNGVWYYTSNGPTTSLGASTTNGALYSQAYSTAWVGLIAQDYRNGRLFVRGKNNNSWLSWLRVALTGESLPASDVYAWAKASTKPSYTASEVGAVAKTGDSMSGCLHITGTTNWCEGIRIYPYNTWTTLILGASGSSGTNADAWSFHTNAGTFYLANNGANSYSNGLSWTKAGALAIKSSASFTYNGYTVYTAGNCTIPSKTSQLTNDSGFITGGSFVAKSGDTMTGTLTMSNDKYIVVNRDGRGITFGLNSTNTYIGGDTSSMYMCLGKNLPIRFLTNNTEQVRITNTGTLSVGSSNPATGKLYVNGLTYVEGNVSASTCISRSDLRLKDVQNESKSIDIKDIANAPVITFKWKNKEIDNLVHIGTSAQYWNIVLPESVFKSYDDYLSMDYGATALTSAITVAREVVELDKKIKLLEEENKQLKEELLLLKSQINDILTAINKSTNNK